MAAIAMAVLLSGCGWFDGPPKLEKLRPGAERALSPSESLPGAGGGHSYDAEIVPNDETRGGPAIGSVVAASGGQKAQLEKLEKDAAARDAEDRAAREKADAERAKNNPDSPAGGPATPSKEASTGDRPGEPPTQPAAPAPAPVTSTPVPPPPSDGPPLDPNNTPTKPAGT